MPSCNTYSLTWVSLTLGVGISSWLLQQSSAIAPYLGWGVSPHRCPSWPSTWDSSSRPSCARAAMAPWMWGWSSRPQPLASVLGSLLLPAVPDLGRGVTPLIATPDLRRGVAPLGCPCALTVWYSRPLPLTSDVGWLLSAALGAPVVAAACGWLIQVSHLSKNFFTVTLLISTK